MAAASTKKVVAADAAASAAAPAPAVAVVAPIHVEQAADEVVAADSLAITDDTPPTSEPAASDVAWPVSVELHNESGFPLSLRSGLFVSPAGSAQIVLHDADHAKRIRDEVRSSAVTAYISDQVHLVGFPHIPE